MSAVEAGADPLGASGTFWDCPSTFASPGLEAVCVLDTDHGDGMSPLRSEGRRGLGLATDENEDSATVDLGARALEVAVFRATIRRLGRFLRPVPNQE